MNMNSATLKTVNSYVAGFTLSVGMTLAAYGLATGRVLHGMGLLVTLAGLALVQALVQLLFFLHLRDEREPRWKLLVFDFMLLVLAILVFGTLWIMNSLDYNMRSPQPTDTQIIDDEGIKP